MTLSVFVCLSLLEVVSFILQVLDKLAFKVASLMYSYNRIHNDVDNVVRVELNSSSSYRPHSSARTATLLRQQQQPKKATSSLARTGTFTKHEKEKPSRSIVRSETFILKHHEESPEAKNDDKSDFSTFTRTNKKDNVGTTEKKYVGDKSDYNTYTRSKKKGKLFNYLRNLMKLICHRSVRHLVVQFSTK